MISNNNKIIILRPCDSATLLTIAGRISLIAQFPPEGAEIATFLISR